MTKVTLKALCPNIEKYRKNTVPGNINPKAANELPVTKLGTLNIKYTLAQQEKIVPTVITTSLSEDLILGIDFFEAMGLKIGRHIEVLTIGRSYTEPVNYKCEQALNEADKWRLYDVVMSLPRTKNGRIGRTTLLKHKIELIEGAKQFVSRPYYFSPVMEERINGEIDKMLDGGIIGPSNSPVCSPIVPVTKQNGSIRLCLDSRRLNEITVKDRYPMPNIPHLLSRMAKVRHISSLDLSQAFWQVPLCGEREPTQFASAQQLTAFVVPGRGLFEYKVMPFGLCNAPATQCRLMDLAIGHDLSKNVYIYVDDILIIAETTDHMLQLIGEIAARLQRANLTINLEKSVFFAKHVKFVGFIISKEGISIDPEKTAALSEYPQPTTLKSLRRFLGMTGYYRRLMQGYSEIAAPLTDMLRHSAKFEWDESRRKAFEALRKAMTTAPVVATPDFDKEFVLQTDASDVAAGAALGQIQGDKEVVIGYYSKKWGDAERKLGATAKEAAAVLLAIKHFRNYLWGRRFTVITDAKALTHVKTIHTDGSSKLSRWVLELNSYDMVIRHRAGKASLVPDALSRAVEAIDTVPLDAFQSDMLAKIAAAPTQYPDFRAEGNRILQYTASPDDIGCFSYVWKEYVPEGCRQELIRKTHRSLWHFGAEKCVNALKRAYFWPGLREEVKTQIGTCGVCKMAKVQPPLTRVPMGASRRPTMPFEMLALDHWGPVTRSRKGNKYLLVIVDLFTKYVFLKPCPNTQATRVTTVLEEVFSKFGTPRIMITDNYRPLIGRTMREFLQRFEVTHWTIPFYHSQANPCERYIRTISTAIRALVLENGEHQEDWDRDLPRLQWAINTTLNKTTGKSPFVILFGREPAATGNDYERAITVGPRGEMSNEQLIARFTALHNQVRIKMEAEQAKFRIQYDKGKKEQSFQVGEEVWIKNRQLSDAAAQIAQKLTAKYIPATITEVLGPQTYKVQFDGNRTSKLHANDIKRH